MTIDRLGSRPSDRRDRVHLRAAVLHIGGLLGWEPSDIIAFTEGLTNRPWRRCGCDEFQAVLEEYLAMGRAIQAKAARRQVREQGAISLKNADSDDAVAW